MISKYDEFCPLEQRAENAVRIRKGITIDMKNGNRLHNTSISFLGRFIKHIDKREEIFSNYLLKMAKNTPESFKYVVNGLEPIGQNPKFKSWSFTIIKNLGIDYLRYHQRRREINFSTFERDKNILISGAEQRSDNIEEFFIDEKGLLPEQEFAKQEKTEKLLQAISQLPIKQQDLINLRYFEEETYEDIAERLKIPVGTVKSGLYSIKNKLKRRLVDVL